MGDVIKVECREDFVPPVVRVIFFPDTPAQLSTDFPTHDYRRLVETAGFPDVVCPTK